MASPTLTRITVLLGLALAAGASAQDKAAVPAAPQQPLSQVDADTAGRADPSVPVAAPDTRPLTGSQLLTLGSSGLPSFLAPKLHFAQMADSNPTMASGNADWSTLTSISGELDLLRHSRTKEFKAHYEGGGLFYANQNDLSAASRQNSTFQRLALSQRLDFGRWTLLASDEVSYVTASAFGSAVSADAAIMGPSVSAGRTSLAGLNPSLLPSQNLVSQIGSQISNTVVLETDYRFSARSSVTLTGNYGILRSPDASLIDSNQEGISAGYNRNLTARDTIGVKYSFMQYGYQGGNGRLRDHTAQLIYGRRITGRLSLQVAAGGGMAELTGGGFSRSTPLWNAQGTLHYFLRRTDFTVSYIRSVNAGSGVLLGANSDVVTTGVSRQLSRQWLTSASFSYSHNLAFTSANSFSTYFFTTGARRAVGRYTGVFANYSFQRQAGVVLCPACAGEPSRHTVSVGFDWSCRPIRLE